MPRVAERAPQVQERTGTTSAAHGLGLDRLASLSATLVGSDSFGPAPHPYGGRIAVAERHWDGSARRRNVDSVTARVGDR